MTTTTCAYDPLTPDTDPLEALWALATARGARKHAEDPEVPAEPDAWLPFAIRRLGPAFRATEMGHKLTWDPPAALTSIDIRWTCTRCGEAVLARAYELEDAYGSALTIRCNRVEVGTWVSGGEIDWSTPNSSWHAHEFCGNCGLDTPGCGCPRDCISCQEIRVYCGHLDRRQRDTESIVTRPEETDG